VEAALLESGLADCVSLVAFTQAAGEASDLVRLDRIRTQTACMRTPILQAFDGVLTVPSVSVEPGLEL
jgi:erythromycin esterase